MAELITSEALMALAKFVAEDDVAPLLKNVADDVRRLIEGYYRDGLAFLDESLRFEQSSVREERVRQALDAFIRAGNRTSGAAAARAALHVSRCYEILQEPDHARRWLLKAHAECVTGQADAAQAYVNYQNSGTEALKYFGALLLMFTGVGIIISLRHERQRNERVLQLLEMVMDVENEARRIRRLLPADEVVDAINYWFPVEAVKIETAQTSKYGRTAFAVDCEGHWHRINFPK